MNENTNLNKINEKEEKQTNINIFDDWGFPNSNNNNAFVIDEKQNINNLNIIRNEADSKNIINNNKEKQSTFITEQGELLCAICGTKLFNKTISHCPKCGSNFPKTLNNNLIEHNEQNNDLNNSQYNIELKKKTSRSSIVFLVLSIINLLSITPLVVNFGALWLIFGAFSNDKFQYYSILLCCCGYLFASVIGLIAFIINVIKNGRILKKCFLAILISFCLGIIIPIVLNNTNYSTSKSQIKKNNLVENKTIYQDNDLNVKQVRIDYDKRDVKVYFSLSTLQIDNYLLPTYLSARVNQCAISNVELKKSENSNNPNLYYLSISYSDLKIYNIKDIYMIDFSIYNLKDKKNIDIKFEISSKSNSMLKTIGLENDELIYANDYFKLYFDSNYDSGKGNLYVESLVTPNYSLSFLNSDFDTKGYINDHFSDIKLYDYTITQKRISFHPCNENMHYIKFDYIIRDENFVEIAKEYVEFNFTNAKINTKYCRET